MLKCAGLNSISSVGNVYRANFRVNPENIRYMPSLTAEAVPAQPPISPQNFLTRLRKSISRVFAGNSNQEPPQIKIGLNDIKYGKKKVGHVEYDIRIGTVGNAEKFPQDWFTEGQVPGRPGFRPMKPYMWIDLLYMNDRLHAESLTSRAKKYGAMAMKKLLEIANAAGCENRIALKAACLPVSHLQPGGFYHKMGFSPAPNEIKFIKKLEADYLAAEAELLKAGRSKSETAKILAHEGYVLPECSDGRYVIGQGHMVLTNPECIENYSV